MLTFSGIENAKMDAFEKHNLQTLQKRNHIRNARSQYCTALHFHCQKEVIFESKHEVSRVLTCITFTLFLETKVEACIMSA